MSVGKTRVHPYPSYASVPGMTYRQYLIAEIASNPGVKMGDGYDQWAKCIIGRANAIIEALDREKSSHG